MLQFLVKIKTNLMKSRIFSLAALILLVGAIVPVSAIRIQSTSVSSLKVSQIRQSGETPFLIRGKIWGPAPTGEVSRILYRLTDTSGTTTWEFTEPFVHTYTGKEELDLTFEFDFSKELINSDSTLIVELQKSSMNGAFAQTVARGSMALVFPKTTQQKTILGMETATVFVDGQSIVSRAVVQNGEAKAGIFIKVNLRDAAGEIISTNDSAKIMIDAGQKQELSVLLNTPPTPGRYMVEIQGFADKKAVTGIKKLPVVVQGEFALLSALEIMPQKYIYKGETATVVFSGASSLYEQPLSIDFRVQNAQKEELFAKNEEVMTDAIGRFSGEFQFLVENETEQMHIVSTIKKGTKEVGSYSFATPVMKKMLPSQGQSSMSFAIESASQEFLFSSPRAKIGLIAVIVLLLLLVVGFFFFLRHIRHANILVLFLALTLGGIVQAEGITSLYPAHRWVINPQAELAQENFKKVLFEGTVDFGTGGVFPVGEPIAAQVKIGTSETISTTFETIDPNQYYFIVTIPSSLPDGTYPLELEMTWDGITLPGGSLEIELLYAEGQPLLLLADGTPPTTSFDYFSGGTLLNAGEYSNVPVDLGVVCDDETGCLSDTENRFEVKGNFCTGGTFCTAGAVDDFVICDAVANCADPMQVEINQYDPIAPTLDDFDVTKEGVSAKTQLKAFESYILSFLNLADPTEDATIVVDEHACSNLSSPFFIKDSLCVEKTISCALDATRRGIIDQQDAGANCLSTDPCPPGTTITPEGDCELATCDYHHFPYCFDWILGGSCSTFPFCFEMILQ